MAQATVKKKRGRKSIVKIGKRCHGFFDGESKDRWRAAFEYRIAKLAKHIYISCSEAMAELRDDAGQCPFTDCDIKKNQWKLQRMFNQLEADNFKEPPKGEIYIMLFEILYGTKEIAFKVKSADGDEKVEVVNVDLDPNEKTRILAEMNRMGGHYAPEKSEHRFDLTRTEHIILELHKMEKEKKVKEISDSKNRIKKHLQD